MSFYLPALVLLSIIIAESNPQLLDFNLKGIIPDFLKFGRKEGSGYLDPNLSLSPLCLLSSLPLFNEKNGIGELDPSPGFIESDDLIGFAFDFTADMNAFNAYGKSCHLLGGQFIVIQIDNNDACNWPDSINSPQCLGASCSQYDLDGYGSFFADVYKEDSTLPACVSTTIVDSIDGVRNTDVPEVCLRDMANIFLVEDVYSNFLGGIVNKDSGRFTGDIGALRLFSNRCELAAGRIIQMTVNYYSVECEIVAFSSVPACIASSCNDDDAKLIFHFILQFFYSAEDSSCQDVMVTFEGTGKRPIGPPSRQKGLSYHRQPKSPSHQSQPKGINPPDYRSQPRRINPQNEIDPRR